MFAKWIVLLFATLVMSELSGEIRNKQQQQHHHHIMTRSAEHTRQTRALVHKPLGFFGKLAYMGGLLFQQYNDTRNAFVELKEIFQDQFSDTAPKKPLTTTKAPSSTSDSGDDAETTTERYRISRKEFGEILGRNLRGLRKLARIELNDSYNQSYYTIQEYKQQWKDQVKPKGGIHAKRLNLTISNNL
ncbi:hypothetical protein PVAND_013940 [Polypedilum vanderplanki]|uniref:Uncharacterized protein n=1 Tax=Polypedilum vanderplanki TaxID=319348 RepID=A0A9J6CST1_POLVA|nr:hypothetical protein PVAND_013940 [Polypedilum vanderplanki]